jgi:signal transduction histidine kinase
MTTLFVIAWIAIALLHIFFLSHARRSDMRQLAKNERDATLQHDRTMTIVNNLADAIIVTDQNGIVQINNAASLVLLDTNVSVVGKPIDEIAQLTVGDSKDLFKLHSELKRARGVVSRDDVDLVLGDEHLHLSVIFSPIRGSDSASTRDHSEGYIIIMRDITRAKSLEEERDEFISVVSHELRTPITIAEGSLSNLQLMLDKGVSSPDALNAGVAMAHDQVIFLASMINDLSTLSRAERGVADDAVEIAVEPFIHGLFNQYQPEATKKNLQLNLDLDPDLGSVVASELYLHELLQNFVTNSLKYTKEGSVTIRVKKHGDNLNFSVSDTGIGISKADQKRVFDKFFRSEDYRTRETGGTGLGLYVAAKLSRKLHTQITLESHLNHGSTFGFSMPRK